MTTALEGARGQRHTLSALYPRERPSTHCTGGWVGPRAGLDGCGKSRPPPGFNPRTVQPVASHYIDYATRPTAVLSFSYYTFMTSIGTASDGLVRTLFKALQQILCLYLTNGLT